MNLIEEANLIEETEKNLRIVINCALNRGLPAFQILRLFSLAFQDLLMRASAESYLKEKHD